jgi:hypothetical protein
VALQSAPLEKTTIEWRTLTQRDLLIWVAVGLALCHFIRAWGADIASPSVESLFSAFSRISAFCYLAWYAVFRLLLRSDDRAVATTSDIVFCVGMFGQMAILNSVPTSGPAGWVAVTIAAVYFLLAHGSDQNVRGAAAILLALATNGLWGPALFNVFAPQLLKADAALVGAAVSVFRPDIQWHGTTITNAGHSIIIYSPCSSFHNISLAFLGWLAITKLERANWLPSDIPFCLAICLVMVLLNATRLYLMALNFSLYDYWHNGFGKEVFGVVCSLLTLTLSLWSASRRQPVNPC